jgi:exosome complex component RRP45
MFVNNKGGGGGGSVLAVATCDVVAPQAERPTEGFFKFDVEFSPMCDLSVEAGRPSVRAVAVSRVVERSLRDSDAVDVESLCIIAGEKVWSIRCVAHVLDDGGNVTDCVSLAVAAALLHCRRPDLTVDGHRVVLHSTRERAPVPLGIHHLPICVSFDFFDADNDDEFTEADLYADDNAPKRSRLADNFVLDATTLERDACRGTVTMAFNAHGELCLINKSGGVPLTPARILHIASIAKQRAEAATSAVRDALDRAGVKLPRAFNVNAGDVAGEFYKPPSSAAGADAATAAQPHETEHATVTHRVNVDGGGRTTLASSETLMTVTKMVDPATIVGPQAVRLRRNNVAAIDDDNNADDDNDDNDDIESKTAVQVGRFGVQDMQTDGNNNNDDDDDDASSEERETMQL